MSLVTFPGNYLAMDVAEIKMRALAFVLNKGKALSHKKNPVGQGEQSVKLEELSVAHVSSCEEEKTLIRFEPGCLTFRCNICGQACLVKVSELSREAALCQACGSTMRARAIINILSIELFGASLALPDFPVRRDLTGAGMSDWDGYALTLAEKFSYKNTFFHQEPKLDITNPDPALEGQFDFIISSDVFEHVAPPIALAFENVRKLLKPTGVLIFSVPYSKNRETIEHFPELHDYRIDEAEGHYTLRNITRDGVLQIFEDPVFHGGAGATLEMRVFSESSLLANFAQAGFSKVKICKAPDFEQGIYWEVDWSLPMSARLS